MREPTLFDFGGLLLSFTEDGYVRMEIENDPVHVWSWARHTRSPEPFRSLGYELALALSLVDGSFEIVPRQ